MKEPEDKVPVTGLPAEANQEVLEELMEKDAKSGRSLTRFWYWATSLMGIFMVLFYMYNAGISPVGTQYHRGIYVLITFVMVFLNYPMMSKSRTDRPSYAARPAPGDPRRLSARRA